MRALTAIILLVLLACGLPAAHPQTGRDFSPSERSYRKAKKLLARMTTEEKIGQLVHIGVNARYLHRNSPEFQRLRAEISDRKVGGVIVFAGPVYETVHLVNRLQEFASIPLLVSADFESGVGMRLEDTINFPWAMALAAGGDKALAREAGSLTGAESRAVGVRMVFAPVVDINDNPLNPVINIRSFGEDPVGVSEMAKAFAEGLQSKGVIATAKHFPGHGNTAVDSHIGLPVIAKDRSELESGELFPFRALIENGVAAVMVSHISVPALDPEPVPASEPDGEEGAAEGIDLTVPASLSKKIVGGLLIEKMGFQGLVVTDALDMSGLTLFYGPGEAAVRSLEAGNDILLKPGDSQAAIAGLNAAFRNGRISADQLDRAVLKQLAWKYELGLFKRRLTPIEEIDAVVSSPAAADLAARIADKALTLVALGEDSLPLKEGAKVLVVCVTNGQDIGRAGWPLVSHLRENGLEVERIALDERSSEEDLRAVVAKASAADAVVAALFVRVASGSERSTVLPKQGSEVFRRLSEASRPPVVVSFGNPYLINVLPGIQTYVSAYGDMPSLQKAAAEKLSGRSEFLGRLPVSLSERYRAGTGRSLNGDR